MLSKRIAGATHCPGAPADWKEQDHGKCIGLPIRVIEDPGSGFHVCESAWEPTPKELEMLNAGGQIVLRVWGWQVPVALYVEPAANEKQEE